MKIIILFICPLSVFLYIVFYYRFHRHVSNMEEINISLFR